MDDRVADAGVLGYARVLLMVAVIEHPQTSAPRSPATGAAADLAADVLRFGGSRAWIAATLTAGAALGEGIGLALLAPLLAILTGKGGGAQHAADRAFGVLRLSGHESRLAVIAVLFLLAITARVLIAAARERVLHDLTIDYVDARRASLIRRLAGARWSAVVALRHARLSHALSGEVVRLGVAVQMLLAIPVAAAMLAAQAVLIAMLAPWLGLAALAMLALAVAVLLPLTRRAFAFGEVGSRRHVEMADIGAQLLGGLKLALAHDLGRTFVAAFETTLGAFAAEQRRYDRRRVRADALTTLGAAAALAGLVMLGEWWAIPTPALLASLAVLWRMVGPATGLLRDARLLAQALPAHRALIALESDLAQAGQPRPAGPAPAPMRGVVRVERVSFTYPGGAGVRDLDLLIAPGEAVGLAGPSGAGKTTVIDLLCGLLDPDGGAITVGGVPLRADTIPAWRRRIAYVPQEPYLFNGSIRANLCWGHLDLPDDALWAALDRVEAGAVVRAIAGGLDAPVAERGARLSGGQRQRLALARALLRRPDLLILDEATSAIDAATEAVILDRLIGGRGKMAVLLSSHSAPALALCSHIVELDRDGRMVAPPRG